MSTKLQVLVLLLLVCSFNTDSTHQSNIYIDGDHGKDLETCLTRGALFPCRTLSYAFKTTLPWQDVNDNVVYTLSVGTHYLNETIEFTELQNITIAGSGRSYNDSVIICTSEEGGLKFNNSSTLRFEMFSLINCSFNTSVSHLNSNWYSNRAAMIIYECFHSVRINNVNISFSPNATALVLLDTSGHISVTNSVFNRNGPIGRGVHVHTTPNFILRENITYQFINCSIAANSVTDDLESENNTESCVPLNRGGQTYSYGGGMSVVLQNNGTCFAIKIEIVSTKFIRNKARCGGGLFLAIEYNSINNSIQLSDCLFETNICTDQNLYSEKAISFGGGLRLEHLNTHSTNGQNYVSIENTNFRNNSAFSGGGLSISPLAHTDTKMDLLVIRIINTHFFNNSGNVGAAIQVSLIALRVQTKPPKLSIENSTFCHNNISVENHSLYQNGVGAVYTNQVPISFKRNIFFKHNHGTALAAVGTYLLFDNCIASFENNNGAKGGAIALLGVADLIVSDSTEMIFMQNHATLYGGAIYNTYIEQENLIAYYNCFARPKTPFKLLNKWTANFTFINNSAEMAGNSTFTTSIYPCKVKSKNILCSERWKYIRNGQPIDCTKEISTEPGNITTKEVNTIKTVPGKINNLNFKIQDDLGHDLSKQTVFAAHMMNGSKKISVDSQFKYISDQNIKFVGNYGSQSYLHLRTTGHRAWHLHILVELSECPPGFTLYEQKKCKVNISHTFRKTVECDSDTFESFLVSGYWMGYLDNNTHQNLVVSLCPPGFCAKNENEPHRNPVTNTSSREKLCNNRKGILCGMCRTGHGPAVNFDTPTCVRCNGENISKRIVIYIFTVYVPLLVLFSLMILFGVKLTTGPANAFIIYSQMISSTFNIDADGHLNIKKISEERSNTFKKAYRLPYGLFNLEFVENLLSPFCISSNLNSLDVFQLDYLVALTPLAMIVIVLVCFKLWSYCVKVTPAQVVTKAKSFWIRLKSGDNILHAFAAFILLSYTKFSLTSAYIIKTTLTFNATGDFIKPDRVYFAGQYSMADTTYLVRYFFPACFFLFIVTLPPLFLLSYPTIILEKCLMRFPKLWKYYPVDKVHILLDTFQSCYKDNCRFFAGLYFLFRLAINIAYILAIDWYQRFMVQQIISTVLVLLIALFSPYRIDSKFLNYVDLLMFGNLAIINALSFYIYYRLHDKLLATHTPDLALAVQYVLVFLPLFYMITYCGWKLIGTKRRTRIKQLIKRLKHTIQGKTLKDTDKFDDDNRQLDLSASTGRARGDYDRVRAPPTSSEVIIESSEYAQAESGDETLIVRSRQRNTYRAARRVVEANTQSQGLLHSGERMRKNTDSGISSSHTSHTDSVQHLSPLLPILSVESEPKNYGSTD